MGWKYPQNGGVPKLKEIQGVLAANVERLRKDFAPQDSRTMNRFAKYCGIGNSALQALKDGTGDPQLSTICKVAEKFKMDAWQLLIQGASPDHRPRATMSEHDERKRRLDEMKAQIEDLAREIDGDGNGNHLPTTPAKRPKQIAHRRRKNVT